MTLNYAPGAENEYASPNYLVLGAIVEEVSGRSYASYVQTSIFDPLRMRDSHVDQATTLSRAYPGRLSSGHVYVLGFPLARTLPHEADRLATAALISSAADLGRFLVAQLDTTPGDLLSVAGFQRMHAGGAPTNGYSYAFGWRDGTVAGERAVHHGGIVPNFRGKMVMLPERRVGVVVLTNVSSAIPWPIAPASHVMADEITATLIGVPPAKPSNEHRLLFGAVAIAMLLISLNQLRGLRLAIRRENRGISRTRTVVSILSELTFVAAVAFLLPRAARLSWHNLLAAAPDVAWWLIFGASISILSVGAHLRRLPRYANAVD